MSGQREIVNAEAAPAAIGAYSHAVRSGGLLFCSGQVGLDPATMELVAGGPGEQARRCLDNLEAVCAAAGARLADAVRVTIFLSDFAAFTEVNDVYATYFEQGPPARVTVGVAALPKGALVEIDAVVAILE